MPDYDNNFTGIISRNDKKEKPTHPDQTGQCTIDGVEYWLNGWIKERKDGTGKFLSLSFKPKEARAATSEVASSSAGQDEFEF